MQALLHYAQELEPLPERFRDLDRAEFTVPECQTRVDLFPEMRDGKLYFYVDVNARQSPDDRRVPRHPLLGGERPSAGDDARHPGRLRAPDDGRASGWPGARRGSSAMVARVKRHAQRALAA